MVKGSCLCGAVAYEIDGPLREAVYCHCSLCRKSTGSTFATNVVVSSEDFHITRGEELLKAFPSPTGNRRTFCSECGSTLFSRRVNTPEITRVRMGSLDTPVDIRPSAHIFVGSKAHWDEIGDGLPQHAERP
jgi:hypothetical protein